MPSAISSSKNSSGDQVIGTVISYAAGQRLIHGRVNHYITDGDVAAADLM